MNLSGVCAVIAGVLMFATPIVFLVWLVKLIRKKPAKKAGAAVLLCTGLFVVSVLVGAFSDPATYCNHEYILVEAEPADCESGGFETYQCSLCGKNKTEKIEKLGHNMADVRRVEPTYDEDGEYVRCCTRCGYEEIEVLQKIELPTSTTELNKKSKPEIEGKPSESTRAFSDSDVDLAVSYDDIYNAYKENELVANDLYRYNRYRITAEINGMSTGGLLNLTGGATLTMERRVGNTIVFFYAEFEKEQEEALKKVKVGDTITFDGKCIGKGGFTECELIPEA